MFSTNKLQTKMLKVKGVDNQIKLISGTWILILL